MHTIGIRANGVQPYEGCKDVTVDRIGDPVVFPVCMKGSSIVTHCMVDGLLYPLDKPVEIGQQMQPRFPKGSIKT